MHVSDLLWSLACLTKSCPSVVTVAKEAEDLVNQRVIRPDAVLIIGSLSVTGQWMTLKTMEQGLNARILTKEFDKAEDCFGTDGANLDIYYGDAFDDAQLENAMEGIKVKCDGRVRWSHGRCRL